MHVPQHFEQWRQPCGGEALVLLRGADGYVSPSWYASEAEPARVAPTWSYVAVHAYGTLVVHDDGLTGRPR